MSMLFWGLTIGMVGKIVLGIAVVRVHMIMLREHKLDTAVFNSIKRERLITILGVLLIILGYVLEITFYNIIPFASCAESNCAASLGAVFDAWQ